MAVRLTIAAIILLAATPLPRAVHAATCPPACESSNLRRVASGSLVRASQPAVYYVADDGRRYVFPNEKTYRSWYADFSSVQRISNTDLAALPLGGNITYKPGPRLLKIESDPKVYAVDHGGVLRWIETEDAAVALFGTMWNRIVDDVPVAFFVNYRTGASVNGHDDYDPGTVASGVTTIAADLAVARGTRPAPASTLAVATPPASEPSPSPSSTTTPPSSTTTPTSSPAPAPSPPPTASPTTSCASNPSPVLTADITPLDGVSLITPPGSHTHGPGTVTTHSYIWTNAARVPVIAPVDMTLESGSYSRDNADSPAQYLLFFRVSCEVKVKFDHIDEPVAAIRSQFPGEAAVGDSRTTTLQPIVFRAGDTIAHTTGTRRAGNWDVGAYNTTKAAGVNNDHADCPYAYYPPAQRAAYAAKFGSGVQSDPETPRTHCNADGTSAVVP